MFEQMNTTTQGNVGLGACIGTCCKHGFVVCLPLNDNQDYDVVVDFGSGPKTVQVKTTKRKAPNKHKSCFIVTVSKTRFNRTLMKTTPFDPAAVDYLYVLTEEGIEYMIPTFQNMPKTAITLNETYDKYVIGTCLGWLPNNPGKVE